MKNKKCLLPVVGKGLLKSCRIAPSHIITFNQEDDLDFVNESSKASMTNNQDFGD